jgi:hypothetical protein
VGVFDRQKSNHEPRWLGSSAQTRTPLIPSISAARWLLVLVVAAGVYFFYGFLVPVLAALVIGFASWPLYRKLLARVGGNTTIAATIAIIMIITFLVIPIGLAVTYTTGEVRTWVTWAIHANRAGAPTPDWIVALPWAGAYLDEVWTKYIGSPGALGEVIQAVSGANIGNIYRAVLAAGGGAFHLLLTLLFRFMKPLIEHGYVYMAQPPLYRLRWNKPAEHEFVYSDAERDTMMAHGLENGRKLPKENPVQRYKGLGEMNAKELWETTMDPAARVLLQVTMDDAATADELFSVLMGEDVESRRSFITRNARDVRFLDV